jgi:predicted MFS family arabinose efflux permease
MFASDAVIGLTVGGIIIQNYGWMTTFFTIIPVEIGLLVVIRFFIHINEKGEWIEKLPGNGQEKQGQAC